MNRLILEASEQIAENRFKIVDPEKLKHIQEVLKCSEGDRIKVCFLNKSLNTAEIIEIEESSLSLELTGESPKKESWCKLLIGLSRPPTCQKIVEHGSTMGVSHFHFFKAELSEKSYGGSKFFKDKKYESFLRFGLSQSSHYYKLPEVTIAPHPTQKSFENVEQKYILSPFGEKWFNDYEIDFSKKLILAIGPERGWTSKEVDVFKNQGFKEVVISEAILRVEAAVYSSLSQLELLKRG